MNLDSAVYSYLGKYVRDSRKPYTIIAIATIAYGIKNKKSIPILFGGNILRGALSQKRRNKLNQRIIEINSHPEKYPLEHVENTIIIDTKGLELILEKTNNSTGIMEWGTLHKNIFYERRNSAVIPQIISLDNAKKYGTIKLPGMVYIPNVESYGKIHYHPVRFTKKLSAINYAINMQDIFALKPNNIGIITFKTSKGPEIIAYNTQHVYIPITKEKNFLVKADKDKIIQYLESR